MAGVDQLDGYVVLMVQTAENCGFSAVAVHQGRRQFPVVLQRPIPIVLATIETAQLRVDTVVDAPIQVVQIFPVVAQRTDSHGLVDHGDSACPWCEGL